MDASADARPPPQCPRTERATANILLAPRRVERLATVSSYDEIQAAVAAVRVRAPRVPAVGVVLGSGLGAFADRISEAVTLPYSELPHFAESAVAGHRGVLIVGQLDAVPIAVMAGRVHYYEGHSMQRVTFPVRVLAGLGVRTVLITNAAGGSNTDFAPGDFMVIRDHINLTGHNPLRGPNDDRLGPRFPDMSCPYDPALIDQGLEIARRENFVAHRGVTVAVTGPNLETRAEYRFLRLIGADVVAMSTVPEAIVAVHCGLRIFGLSVISDMCLPDNLKPANLAEIIATANSAEPKLAVLVEGVIKHDWSANRA